MRTEPLNRILGLSSLASAVTCLREWSQKHQVDVPDVVMLVRAEVLVMSPEGTLELRTQPVQRAVLAARAIRRLTEESDGL